MRRGSICATTAADNGGGERGSSRGQRPTAGLAVQSLIERYGDDDGAHI